MKAKIRICPHQFLLILIVLTTAISCNKDEVDPIIIEDSVIIVINKDIEPVVDIDGNIYQAVEIGTQTWMMENLKVTHYRNGDSIPNVRPHYVWRFLSTGAWCHYPFFYENINIDSIYGKLYNWYAVDDPRGLAPEGWHVPSEDEWNILIDYLGGEAVAGGKMKSISEWALPNVDATNSSCFTGLPGGAFTGNDNEWVYVGWLYKAVGYWWSSTRSHYVIEATGFNLGSSGGSCWSYDRSKKHGLSVRCVKD